MSIADDPHLVVDTSAGRVNLPQAYQVERAQPELAPTEQQLLCADPEAHQQAMAAAEHERVRGEQDTELAQFRAQMAAAHSFAEELRGYCSPHEVSVEHADGLVARLDAAAVDGALPAGGGSGGRLRTGGLRHPDDANVVRAVRRFNCFQVRAEARR